MKTNLNTYSIWNIRESARGVGFAECTLGDATAAEVAAALGNRHAAWLPRIGFEGLRFGPDMWIKIGKNQEGHTTHMFRNAPVAW
jgi:hypothetical protein